MSKYMKNIKKLIFNSTKFDKRYVNALLICIRLKPLTGLPRKEVIQPQVLLRLPCYDFTPVTSPTFDSCPLADSSPASGVTGSHGVTGGVYKARERIQRGMLIRVY